MDILQFTGEYRWLSNFEPVQVTIGGRHFPSVEHAYMSCKSDDPNWIADCMNPAHSPGKIKRMSRAIKIRSNWEDIKLEVMYQLLAQKFTQEPFKTKLIATGQVHISEGNKWNDTYWGIDFVKGGQNNLGRLIMIIRDYIIAKKPIPERFIIPITPTKQ